MFRLHIDIPMNCSEEEAIQRTRAIIQMINIPHVLANNVIETINYRLGHDEDRQKSNYLIKNENGHVTNKKNKITLTSDETTV